MEQDHSLLLDEEACALLGVPQRSEVVFQWLTNLKHLLPATTRVEVKANQVRLVNQLQGVLTGSPGPPTRCLLAHCLALLYRLGDPLSAGQSVDMCNAIIRSKDDAPSSLPTRLAAIACLGSLYEQLGRTLLHSFKDSLVNLLKAFRNAESQGRYEILLAVERALRGLGSGPSPCHREIYKVARASLTDRSLGVRWAAAMCLLELQREAVFLWSSELHNMATLCCRAFQGSTYQVRVGVARLLGTLLAAALQPRQPIAAVQPGGRGRTLEEVMDVLTAGFLRGGASFLRASGDMLKGTSSVGKDVRMGVAQACVVMVSTMGSSWLEGSLPGLLGLLAPLAHQPRAAHSPASSACTRACLSYILRSVLGPLLGEKALANAARHVCLAVHTHTAALDSGSPEGVQGHIMLECYLLELARVLRSLASTAAPLITDPCTALLDTVASVLLHPAASARLAAAWCLRSVAMAMPSQRCVLLDRCAERLAALKSSPEAVSGYSAAVAALLAGAQHCALGLPHSKAKLVLGVAEDLLRSANQNSRLSLQRTQAGWLLLSSLCTLGAAVLEHHLDRVLLLVRCVFPPSVREQDMELHRGDCFTWQVTLEGRAGALCVLRSLLLHCRELLTDDIISRLLTPLACAVALLAKCSSLTRSYGPPLRPWAVLYRLRLYQVLALLPPHTYQESYGVVMKELLSDLSGPENATQPCSDLTLLPALCHHDDLMLLGPAFGPLGRGSIEERLHSSSVGGGNLENDPFSLCDGGEDSPAPLPPAVALTAAAVQLFGELFPQVITAHRLQILEQFSRSLSQLKGQKQQTVQTHVCAALCSLLKHLGSSGLSLGPEELRAPALALLVGALENSSPLLRCAAAEGLARLVQAVNDPGFTHTLSVACLERLRSGRDAVARSGHALAVGALYRYVGGVQSPQHLTSCLGVLNTLAQDTSSPELQTWCVYGVCVLLDVPSGGGVCVSVCEPSVGLLVQLLLSSPPSPPGLPHALGRLLHALTSALGPELQSARPAVSVLRASCVLACWMLQTSPDPLVQSQLVSCLQNLYLFCPAHIHLERLVPLLCEMLLDSSVLVGVCCSYVCVRGSVLSCVRQLAQRGALQVAQHAVGLVKELHRRDHSQLELTLKEVGLEGALFLLLDQEQEEVIRRDVQETLVHLLVSGVQRGRLLHWIKLCKDVLSASSDSGAVEPEEEGGDDWAVFRAVPQGAGPFSALGWRTRGFATRCVGRLLELSQNAGPAHFNITLAQELRQVQTEDFLVLHLGELVRMSFMAATDSSDAVRLSGLQALLLIIRAFSSSPEPEFPGHSLLEQYQANVGAALRPAFSVDAPPDVTAKACQVCSAWLSSGVVSDLRDLRRVHQLLVSSLAKLQGGRDRPSPLYNEAAVTMETLAVLQAWAEVYIVAVQRQGDAPGPEDPTNEDSGSVSVGADLLELVQSDLPTLSRLWLAALQDHSALSLPQEDAAQLPAAGGVFFTAETKQQARSHYTSCWAPILHASALWLQSTGFVMSEEEPAHLSRPATPTSMGQRDSGGGAKSQEDIGTDRLNLILGVSVAFLCSPHSEDQIENITSCLWALQALLSVGWPRAKVGNDQVLSVELVSVLHRVMVTREGAELQPAVLQLVQQIVRAAQEHVREKRYSAEVDDGACEKENLPEFGEGRDTGGLVPGRSLVLAALELCLHVLLRKIPRLSPALTGTPAAGGPGGPGGPLVLSGEDWLLVASALDILSHLPSICSPEGSVSVLPSLLFLLLGVLRELLLQPNINTAPQQRALQALQGVVSSPLGRQEKSRGGWTLLLGAALNTVLDTWGNAVDQGAVDQVGVLRVLTVFLVSAGPEVVLVQPVLGSCLRRYTRALHSKDPLVVSVCLQMLTTVFQTQSGVAAPYIRTLGPPLLRYLQGAERRRPQTPGELQGVLEALRAMEALVSASDPTNRPQLMAVFLPILISFLMDENALGSAPSASRALHESALKDLMRLGPQSPSVFRSLMSSSPQLKARLQAAIQGNQESLNAKASAAANRTSKTSPSITLKTNFL
ncbi:HEAT repeat-containing protein 5A [Gadus morhua]|uniref:HEAT repeat-containing protein 5A n=1 Tax=Gadus morhua TaxID=8049 RepID=UPI0011B7D842|nr:HEAT repeat-containing protein 5A [Gadus morhua]XP_030212241.1 HEAT repeat-containing protein 5A [Gadus morhua]